MSRAFRHLSFAARSEVGLKRKNNEDSFGVFPAIGVWCVADGMGGGDDGEIASAEVIQKVDEFRKAHPFPAGRCHSGDEVSSGVAEAVNAASRWIFERASKKKLSGCGSTFVGAVFDATRPDRAIALHAGDSRLYRIRGREIKQITKDHSAAELVGAKSDAELNPMFRGMILRAVGIQRDVEVEATPFEVKKGDVVVVCSDGLSKMVPDSKICSIVRKAEDDVKLAVDGLIDEAYKAGATDNVTVEVVKVGELPPPLEAEPFAPQGGENEDPETRNTSDGDTAPFDSSGGGFDEDGGTVGTAVLADASTDTPSTSRGSSSRTSRTTQRMTLAQEPGRMRPAAIWLTGLAAGVLVGVVVAIVFVAMRGCGPSMPPEEPKTSKVAPLPAQPQQSTTDDPAPRKVAPLPSQPLQPTTADPAPRKVTPLPSQPRQPTTDYPTPSKVAPSPSPVSQSSQSSQPSQSQSENSAEVSESLRELKAMRARHASDANETAKEAKHAKESAEKLQEVCRDKALFGLFKESLLASGASCQILDNYVNQLIQIKASDNGFVPKASELVREIQKFCSTPDAKIKSDKAKRLSALDPTSAKAYELAAEIIMSAGWKGGRGG